MLVPHSKRERILSLPFAPGEVGMIFEADWPGWPQQEMLTWMPPDIQIYGRKVWTTINGPYLVFPPQMKRQIVKELRAYGYTCTEDVDLVGRASGY